MLGDSVRKDSLWRNDEAGVKVFNDKLVRPDIIMMDRESDTVKLLIEVKKPN